MAVGRAGVTLVVVAIVLGAGVPAASAAGPPATADVDGLDAVSSAQVETDRVRLVVDVAADGDAVWRVQYRTDLDDPNTTAAFESLVTDIESDPANYTARFADRIRTTVAAAENATGRAMSARNVTVSARVESLTGDVGVVTYTYEWTNFARVDGDRLVVGDAVRGFFLNERTSLRVQWPERYGVTAVAPTPDSQSGRSLDWDGSETDFGPDQPRVVLGEGVTATNADGDTDDAGGGGVSTMLVFVVVVLAVVVVAVAAVLVRGRGGVVTTDDTPVDASGTADEGDDGGERDEPPIDDELLSNEERVLRLLERRGGRIKQQEVVEALDWTEAKTSQVVSGMREEGTIEGFRLGRENVLTLPDEDLTTDGDEEGER